jgi:hypothetical protein
MHITWLIAAAVAVPALWGWLMHRVVTRSWPEKDLPSVVPAPDRPPMQTIDYQI